jgi:hypothetical protein
MANINIGRVILGGLIAGLIINIGEFVLNAIVLASQWTAVTESIHRPPVGPSQIILFNILGFIEGIAAVWTYAAIRPRFGAGPRTAVYAALLIWLTCYFLVNAYPAVLGIFPASMLVILLAEGIVEIIVATVAGAWFYREA